MGKATKILSSLAVKCEKNEGKKRDSRGKRIVVKSL